MSMQVLILSAGRGYRLMPLTADVPKTLVKLGDRPLLEWQIKSIQRSGYVRRISVVSGYLSGLVEQFCEKHGVSAIFNPFYNVWDNLGSLWVGCKSIDMDMDLLITNGDNVFKPEVFEVMYKPNSITVAVATKSTPVVANDMKVLTKYQGSVIEISKEIPSHLTQTLSPGLIKVPVSAIPTFLEALEQAVACPGAKHHFWLEVFNILVHLTQVVTVEIPLDSWIEVDHTTDLEESLRKLEGFYV